MLRGLLAFAAACVFLSVCAALLSTRRGLSPALQALGIGSFGLVALTHVFEAFSILPGFGWGHPTASGISSIWGLHFLVLCS